MSKETKPYRYFDSPDGEDIFKKLWVVLKPTVATAFGISTADVMLYSHPKGYVQTLSRYAYIGAPVIGVSTVFVCATNIAASLRKKDDILNWFIGGFAAGSVFGVWRKNPLFGFNMGMVLGIAAICKKTAVDNGWRLVPENDFPIANGNVWTCNTDYTLTAPRPGNWTTGK
ncbi:hypothetical protein NQ314_002928 [Rhamnusium bicolor]|uniref:NADH dehydrogenase [ubiquinone] 1 alpha subcomplex subunit 11 n=1 Tax=Rhamnusium bicolor TaxID=1586634 RepID=A0AAV8ZR23_9CUCU|nr:hypothetical protein NQ314_002928 [Rhamnusium bicolor]